MPGAKTKLRPSPCFNNADLVLAVVNMFAVIVISPCENAKTRFCILGTNRIFIIATPFLSLNGIVIRDIDGIDGFVVFP